MRSSEKKIIFIQIITLSRIAAAGGFATTCLTDDFKWLAGILFVYCIISDVLDGFLARTWNAKSQLGGELDGYADKTFVIACILFALIQEAPIMACWVIICREIFVCCIRQIRLKGRSLATPNRKFGIFKNALIWTLTGYLMFKTDFFEISGQTIHILYSALAAVSFINMLLIIKKDWNDIKQVLLSDPFNEETHFK